MNTLRDKFDMMEIGLEDLQSDVASLAIDVHDLKIETLSEDNKGE